ncbi:MAG: hypothetical protein KAQ89_05410 [Planctomycetes bacterium]|nr:hypothetical protein [Planctomycetota bacterium]
MIIRMNKLVLALLVIFAIAGCHHEGASIGYYNPKVEMPFNSVIVLDKDVTDMTTWIPFTKQSRITIDKNTSHKTSTGMLKVVTDIRNRTDHTLRLDVHTKFFDGRKTLIDESPWDVIVLRRQETKTYTVSSLNSEAAMYRVEIMGAE